MKDLSKVKARFPPSIWQALRYTRERWFTSTYSRRSYSQEGEDIVLESLLGGEARGFYVDIGAHHPARVSNTYRFYKRGWRGINVDAAPGSMNLFRQVRPKDINVEAAVGMGSQKLIFYVLDDDGLSTLDKDLAAERAASRAKLLKEVPVTTISLAELLDKYLPKETKIDFLSLDVEGFDDIVLQSNDWNRYRPKLVLVECLGALTAHAMSSSSTYTFMTSQGYEIVGKTLSNFIFKDMKSSS